jgi:hypothetical protein
VPAAAWVFSPFLLGVGEANLASSTNVFVIVCIVAYGAVALIGVPVFFLLRWRVRPRLATLAAAGGLIALVPWFVVVPPFGTSPASYAAVGDCVTVIDGARTWCGHLLNLKLAAFMFALGALGGLTFWLAAVWGDDRLRTR